MTASAAQLPLETGGALRSQGHHPLRRTVRPAFESFAKRLTVVDLFCGCGGLTLGAAQAALDLGRGLQVLLAIDTDADALRVFSDNFPEAHIKREAVEAVFGGPLGGPTTEIESRLRDKIRELDVLLGGPPCQGHSDLNNHTRRDDPKNDTYLLMARAAEVLRPNLILIENVPTVTKSVSKVVERTVAHLQELNYDVAEAVVPLVHFGVAQTRRRHVVLASVGSPNAASVVLSEASTTTSDAHDLRWAIGDLDAIGSDSMLDTPPRASSENISRMRWLLEQDAYDLPNDMRPICHRNDHSYKSMYGRLDWSKPAQTITSGFGSIGQGRYMHPSKERALTPHEAARIQHFPDYFRFDRVSSRSSLAQMIGNAAPPALAHVLLYRALGGAPA